MSNLSGQTFGQYLLLEPIDAGGMATIYQARQPALDRIVAIKVLPEYLIDQPGFLERFKIEAQAIAKLDHPSILPVYDYGQVGRVPYLVMKYVSGGTLKNLLNGPLELRRTAAILRQIAEALDYAHQQGVIHRDIKPGNVLLQDGHRVQLSDFGLAKIVASPTQLTQSGVGVGTPDYMSPEQAQGLPVDARSDIYSLGVVVYQMLTGQVPFNAETALAVMLKHVSEPPPPIRKINPHISEATERVVLRALAKSPDDRYTTAVELANAFERSLDSQATLTILPSALSTSSRRWPWWAGGLSVIALVALVVGALAIGQSLSANPRSMTPTPLIATATTAAAVATPIVTPAATMVQSTLMGKTLYDDFGEAGLDPARWTYTGTFTATLNSRAISIQSGRLTYQIENSADTYYSGGLRQDFKPGFTLVSARVTLQDANGSSDIGVQVNGLDGQPDAWAYIAMGPTDASVTAYLGDDSGTKETYNLVIGNGMPATHELSIGWENGQLVFYVDGQPKKSLAAKTQGDYAWLLFDVDNKSYITGSFDDVRITYADK